jgi:hypothetical protein
MPHSVSQSNLRSILWKDIQIDTTDVTTYRIYELRDKKNDIAFLLHLY